MPFIKVNETSLVYSGSTQFACFSDGVIAFHLLNRSFTKFIRKKNWSPECPCHFIVETIGVIRGNQYLDLEPLSKDM